MAAPLSGIGQQQIPLAQPFQPGGTDQTRNVRQAEQEPREDELQVREAPSAQSQETNTTQDDVTAREEDNFALASNNNTANGAQGRGSVVDIVI
ncbi:MAG: hypothetical protein ACRBCK_09155 [Alphaproteobacteria bacterium]